MSVSWFGPQAGGATISRVGPRGLTRKFSDRKALDGPATRPTTPLKGYGAGKGYLIETQSGSFRPPGLRIKRAEG
jgi:hypothetical protein